MQQDQEKQVVPYKRYVWDREKGVSVPADNLDADIAPTTEPEATTTYTPRRSKG